MKRGLRHHFVKSEWKISRGLFLRDQFLLAYFKWSSYIYGQQTLQRCSLWEWSRGLLQKRCGHCHCTSGYRPSGEADYDKGIMSYAHASGVSWQGAYQILLSRSLTWAQDSYPSFWLACPVASWDILPRRAFLPMLPFPSAVVPEPLVGTFVSWWPCPPKNSKGQCALLRKGTFTCRVM